MRPFLHHHQAVSHRHGLVLVVGDHDGGEARPDCCMQADVAADFAPRRAASRLESGSSSRRRRGSMAKRAAQGHALLLAAGEFTGVAGGERVRAGSGGASRRRGGRWRSGLSPTHLKPEGDVAGDGEVGEEGICSGRRGRGRACAAGRVRMLLARRAGYRQRSLASMKPAIMRRVVVLPQPEGPSSTTSSPCAISRLTSATAVEGP